MCVVTDSLISVFVYGEKYWMHWKYFSDSLTDTKTKTKKSER